MIIIFMLLPSHILLSTCCVVCVVYVWQCCAGCQHTQYMVKINMGKLGCSYLVKFLLIQNIRPFLLPGAMFASTVVTSWQVAKVMWQLGVFRLNDWLLVLHKKVTPQVSTQCYFVFFTYYCCCCCYHSVILFLQ